MTTTRLAFLWHLHQPDYTIPGENHAFLPWVRLHATKSYFDLPWLIGRHGHMRAGLNLSGSLLSQLAAYVHTGRDDTWWELSRRAPADLSDAERAFVFANFFSLHRRIVGESSRYQGIRDKLDSNPSDVGRRFSEQDVRDLQVHFNLGWMGFAARETSAVVRALVDKDQGFSEADKVALFDEQRIVMAKVLELIASLERQGQIEVTATPLTHPILPLIVDSDVMARATPDRPRPTRFAWADDARYHVDEALKLSERELGTRPVGMWPAEGSVSPEVIPIFASCGVRWIASDEDVLMGSSGRPGAREDALYRPYTLASSEGSVAMVFRDHALSDLIGFTYASNPADAAAADFVARVRSSAAHATATDLPLVNVILDGENPWEAYAHDGRDFLEHLYRSLDAAEDIEVVRVCDHLETHPPKTELRNLHSGSWIAANYQIWIGAGETNRGWELLGQTRAFLEEQRGKVSEDAFEAAWVSICAAEGSDWFWWYGDDFTTQHDSAFDELFRRHLRGVYRAVGAEPPAELYEPITSSAPPTAFSPPRSLITPSIDGSISNFYEWVGAGRYDNTQPAGSMMRVQRYVSSVMFGFDNESFYCRVDPDELLLKERGEGLHLLAKLKLGDRRWIADVDVDSGDSWTIFEQGQPTEVQHGRDVAVGQVIEFALPLAAIGAQAGDELSFVLTLSRQGIEVERHPGRSSIALTVPDEWFEAKHWMV